MRQPTTNLTKAEKQEVVTNCDHLAQLKFSATSVTHETEIGYMRTNANIQIAGLHTVFTLEALGLLYLNIARPKSKEKCVQRPHFLAPVPLR